MVLEGDAVAMLAAASAKAPVGMSDLAMNLRIGFMNLMGWDESMVY